MQPELLAAPGRAICDCAFAERDAMSFAARAGLILISVAPAVAAPPENPDPVLRRWFEGLRQPGTGAPCCSISDCRRVEARKGDKGWEIWVDARFGFSTPFWEPVPASKILVISNPTAEAVACFAPGAGVMCFVPPPEM